MKTSGAKNCLREAKREGSEETPEPVLKKRPESHGQFTTISLKPIEPLYTPNDLAGNDFERDINFPGQFPYKIGRAHV